MKQNDNTDEFTFNIDDVPTTTNLVNVYQEGNYIVATTELGITFRHRIPASKILTKTEKGFTLIDREVK